MSRVAEAFDLDDSIAYEHWKTQKLAAYPTDAKALIVPVQDMRNITRKERLHMQSCIDKTNIAICSAPNQPTRSLVHTFGSQFGLTHLDANLYAEEDAITALSVEQTQGKQHGFIPYTNKSLSWHTDGYYNPQERQIQTMVLYCESAAPEGGKNTLLDHEIAYIKLRDENPDYIRVLSDPTVMIIPAHKREGVTKRPDQPGPVFSLIEQRLHMRYTHRKRSVIWRDSPLVIEALACLQALFDSDSAYLFKIKLNPGDALLCHNVLHNRTAFQDQATQKRRIYRARYYDRITFS